MITHVRSRVESMLKSILNTTELMTEPNGAPLPDMH